MRKRIRSGVALLLSLMLVIQLCDGVIARAVEDPTANIVLTTPEDLKDILKWDDTGIIVP